MSAPPTDPDAEVQLGRPLRGTSRVVDRCGLGLPVVLEVDPDHEGAPFPTLYYLTCPLARARISRLEAEGGVREYTARVADDPAFAAALEAARAAYVARREALLPEGSPARARLAGAGIGGARGEGVKCLHAHYAHARAGGPNPIGEEVARAIGPLDCERPCVRAGARNPAWREPAAQRPGFA